MASTSGCKYFVNEFNFFKLYRTTCPCGFVCSLSTNWMIVFWELNKLHFTLIMLWCYCRNWPTLLLTAFLLCKEESKELRMALTALHFLHNLSYDCLRGEEGIFNPIYVWLYKSYYTSYFGSMAVDPRRLHWHQGEVVRCFYCTGDYLNSLPYRGHNIKESC